MAVGTQEAQVLQPVVCAVAVDVIELQGDLPVEPPGQPTGLASRLLQPFGDESLAEVR
jgi:hypothetical protein